MPRPALPPRRSALLGGGPAKPAAGAAGAALTSSSEPSAVQIPETAGNSELSTLSSVCQRCRARARRRALCELSGRPGFFWSEEPACRRAIEKEICLRSGHQSCSTTPDVPTETFPQHHIMKGSWEILAYTFSRVSQRLLESSRTRKKCFWTSVLVVLTLHLRWLKGCRKDFTALKH